METKDIKLIAGKPEDMRALIEGEEAFTKVFGYRVAEGIRDFLGEANPEFLEKTQAEPADVWVHGFYMVHQADHAVIGMGGYKGPPDENGVVEISYGIAPGYQNKGYATEAAMAMTAYAFDSGKVCTVRAHTLPEESASTQVLVKCGFSRIDEVMDPEDGRVWRWEKQKDTG